MKKLIFKIINFLVLIKMSTLQGLAPSVYAQTVSNAAPGTGNPFSDTDAVNHLLNYTGSRSYANYTNISMAANVSNLYLSQAANRSLLVMYNQAANVTTVDVTGPSINSSNGYIVETLGFNKTASTVLTTESFQMQAISPNNGVVNNSDVSNPLTLTEAPTDQNTQNGLNNIRILNQSGLLPSNFSINYSATNVTQSFGTEGVAYFYNTSSDFAPNYKSITGYETLAANNIALNVSTLNTLNATYNYELSRLSYGNPTFNITYNGAGASAVVDAFGTANLTSVNATNAYSYLGFLQSYNYSGLMGATYQTVHTSQLNVSLSNPGNATQAFAYASGNSGLVVNPTFVSVNNVTTLAVAQSLLIADTLNVTVHQTAVIPFAGNPAEPQYNSTDSIVITQQAESLPAGHVTDPLVLTFNSANRYALTNTGSYGVTAAVYYATDSSPPSYLGATAMSVTNPIYNVTMLAPPTYVNATQFNAIPNPGGYNLTANLSGLYAIYNLTAIPGTTSFTVSANNTTNANIVGKIASSANMNFTNSPAVLGGYQTQYAAILNPTNGDYNSTNGTWGYTNPTQYLLLDNMTANGQVGFGVLGGQIDSAFELIATPNGMRLLLTPTDPKGSAVVNTTNVANVVVGNATYGGPTLNFGDGNVTGGSLSYKVAYNGNGPVPYEDFPSTNYVQKYELVFPTAGELAGGIMRVQQVRVNGYDANNTLLNAQPQIIQLGRANIQDLCLNSCNTTIPNLQQITVTCSIIVDVSLSGLKAFDPAVAPGAGNAGTMYVRVPLQYVINNNGGSYSWANGTPSATVSIQFVSNQLYTHQLAFQGKTTNGITSGNITQTWVDVAAFAQGPRYNVTASGNWFVDLRESYDILTFTAGSLYTLNFALYPQVSQSAPTVSNVPYVIPLDSSPTGWSGSLWDLNNGANLNLANGLDLTSMISLTNSGSSVSVPLNITSSGIMGMETITILGTGGVYCSFQVIDSVSQPIYFTFTTKALVDVNDNLGANDHHLLMSNNVSTLLSDGGVYITSSAVASTGHSVGDSIATVSLYKDRFVGTAYTGQTGQSYNTLGYIPDNLSLIPTTFVQGMVTYTTTGLSSTVYRGYANSSSYSFTRANMSVDAMMGNYTQTVVIAPPAQGGSTLFTLDLGQNFGIKLNLNNTVSGDQLTVFTVNKTNVNVSYEGSPYSYVGGQSLRIIDLIQSTNGMVPWVELLYLNNFFVPNTNNVAINYVQAPVVLSSAQYNCITNGYNALQAVQNAVYTQVSSQDVVTAVTLSDNQISYAFNANYLLRNQAKNFYVTLAPLDVAITHYTGNTVNTSVQTVTRYMSLNANTKSYTVAVDTLSAPYNLGVGFNMRAFKAGGSFPSSNWQYNHNLYALRGSSTNADPWTYYFQDYVDFTNPPSASWWTTDFTLTTLNSGVYNGFYNLAFVQAGFAPNSGDIVNLTFNSALIRPVYNGGWSNSITVSPATTSFIDQYELTFSTNVTSKLIQPVITKYHSVSYPSDYVGSGQINTTQGYYNNLQCLSASQLQTAVSVAGLPYQFQSASYFPAQSNGNVASTTWASISAPSNLDLIYRVSNGTTGANFYKNLMSVSPGNFIDVKLLSVFAKDQLVVEDYAGNLSMRVGPDGHFYAGDVSTYSVALSDNQAGSPPVVNGLFVPIFNSDNNLNVGSR